MDMQNVSNLQIPEGAVRTIHDKDNRLIWGRLAYDTKYTGDTEQDGAPTPDVPVPIQVVTGEQTINISDGVNSHDYTLDLGTIELCKIGTYQDYIYQSEGEWYVHKDIEKIVFNGTEGWGYNTANAVFVLSNVIEHTNNGTAPFCDYFTGQANVSQFSAVQNGKCCLLISNGRQFLCKNTSITSADAFKTWLSSHNTTVYYPLATPTDTKITDTTLIGQLEAVHEWMTRYGYNATVTGNLPLIVNRTNL